MSPHETATHFCARRIGNMPGVHGGMDRCESRVAILTEQVMVLYDADSTRCRWCGRPTCVTWGEANEMNRILIDKDGNVIPPEEESRRA